MDEVASCRNWSGTHWKHKNNDSSYPKNKYILINELSIVMNSKFVLYRRVSNIQVMVLDDLIFVL